MLLSDLGTDFSAENRADFFNDRMQRITHLIARQDVDALTQLLQDDQENLKELRKKQSQIGSLIANLKHLKEYFNTFVVNEVES